jgi:FtsZ-binding cell division protein ZapB
MSTAFVGQSERLLTGEEAFERANDEVGVFEVRKVSMNITEIPSPSSDSSAGGATAGPAPGATTGSTTESAEDGPIEAAESSDTETPSNVAREESAEPTDQAEGGQSADATEVGASAGQAEASHSAGQSASDDSADVAEPASDNSADAAEPAESGAGESDRDGGDDETGSESPDRPAAVEEAERGTTTDSSETDERLDADPSQPSPREGRNSSVDESAPSDESDSQPSRDESSMSDHERAVREWAAKDRSDADPSDQNLFREEAEWRKTKSIPALDPDESAAQDSSSEPSSEPSDRRETRSSTNRDTGERRQREPSNDAIERSGTTKKSTSHSSQQSAAAKRLKKLQSAVEARDSRIETLESELSAAQSSREELEETVSALREERSELQSRIEALESELQSANESGGDVESAQTDIQAEEALSGTNLFVRYESKGQPTLSSLEEGAVDPSAVNDNLRLEHHTQFDLADATVDGQAFESFLHDSSRYRFVDWLVRELPYELLDSGATSELQDVFDAVPNVDRIEFDGTVDVQTESGETTTHDFDVVIRDRMGEPLLVAEINDSRDPVRDEAMSGLLSGASSIGESVESLAGAFYVTASFFEPGALEQAKEASSDGGFFSRTDRESYVKVSRKRGYHLCLVEDRHDAFHLTVPEL